jgi:hypothetical protein
VVRGAGGVSVAGARRRAAAREAGGGRAGPGQARPRLLLPSARAAPARGRGRCRPPPPTTAARLAAVPAARPHSKQGRRVQGWGGRGGGGPTFVVAGIVVIELEPAAQGAVSSVGEAPQEQQVVGQCHGGRCRRRGGRGRAAAAAAAAAAPAAGEGRASAAGPRPVPGLGAWHMAHRKRCMWLNCAANGWLVAGVGDQADLAADTRPSAGWPHRSAAMDCRLVVKRLQPRPGRAWQRPGQQKLSPAKPPLNRESTGFDWSIQQHASRTFGTDLRPAPACRPLHCSPCHRPSIAAPPPAAPPPRSLPGSLTPRARLCRAPKLQRPRPHSHCVRARGPAAGRRHAPRDAASALAILPMRMATLLAWRPCGRGRSAPLGDSYNRSTPAARRSSQNAPRFGGAGPPRGAAHSATGGGAPGAPLAGLGAIQTAPKAAARQPPPPPVCLRPRPKPAWAMPRAGAMEARQSDRS